MQLNFKLNGVETVSLEVDYDGSEHFENIINDNNYAIQYLMDLINNGFISITEQLHTIARINEDGCETIIYGNTTEDEIIKTSEEIFNGCMASTSTALSSTSTGLGRTTSSTLSKVINEWSEGETKRLLDLYEQSLSLVGPLKKFKTKKNMWINIAATINKEFKRNFTFTQCENRYKTILKRKKDAVDNNSKSGSSYIPIAYEEEIRKIASIDDSIEPEVTGTAAGVKVIKKSTSQNTGGSSKEQVLKEEDLPRPKKVKSMQETLIEIHNKKEEARERRHREKLECLKLLFGKNEN